MYRKTTEHKKSTLLMVISKIETLIERCLLYKNIQVTTDFQFSSKVWNISESYRKNRRFYKCVYCVKLYRNLQIINSGILVNPIEEIEDYTRVFTALKSTEKKEMSNSRTKSGILMTYIEETQVYRTVLKCTEIYRFQILEY